MRLFQSCIFICVAAVLQLSAADIASHPLQTRAPHGPFHVAGNQLIDAVGQPFLLRGTATTPFRLKTAAWDARSATDFGPHSATSLSAIRLRLNMNALRIAADISEMEDPGYFDQLKSLVIAANRSDLLVVLAASEACAPMPDARLLAFWKRCADVFKDFPNVLFDAFDAPVPVGVAAAHSSAGWDAWQHAMEQVVHTIRSSGARQPVVLMSWRDSTLFEGYDFHRMSAESDILYEVAPRYEDPRTNVERDAQFGFLTASAPLIANDWDLHLDEPDACRIIPADPALASQLVLDNMHYFDSHQISWTVSTYERGKLLEDTVNLLPTKLESGVICDPASRLKNPAGMGRLVLSHMFGREEGDLVVVNVSGGVVLPRGGYSIAYGRIMATQDSKATMKMRPYQLGGVSIDITDSSNVTRPARISWTSAGWGSLNFIVPLASQTGPGRLTIKRVDGTRETAEIQIADAAPALFTRLNCQGPAVGQFTQSTPEGGVLAWADISRCNGYTCSTIAIPVSKKALTKVRLVGNGFRNVTSASEITITIAGVRVPVISYKPGGDAGVDEVEIAIPASLRGVGETDLICHVHGIVSNAVRIAIAG